MKTENCAALENQLSSIQEKLKTTNYLYIFFQKYRFEGS
jgi:hypothetical protein